jgi:hypothetical protein
MKNRECSGRNRKTRYETATGLTVEGVSQQFEQPLMIEWFGEELDCTFFHGLIPYLDVVKRRNKDDGNVIFLLFQSGLQLKTRYLRHADVNDQALGPVVQIGFEECLG